MSYQFFGALGALGARDLAAEAFVRSQKTGKTVLEEMISPSDLSIKMTKPPPPAKGKVEKAKETVAKPEIVVSPEEGKVIAVPGLPDIQARTDAGLGTGAKVAIGVGAVAALGLVLGALRKKKRK